MTSTTAHVTLRRQRVATLRLRGLTALEIAVQLQRQKLVDDSGAPYPLAVIEGDLAALDAEWQTQARDTDAQRARVLAELREVRRAAWAKNDLVAVLRGLQQEAQLCDAPPEKGPPRTFSPVSAADRELLLKPPE